MAKKFSTTIKLGDRPRAKESRVKSGSNSSPYRKFGTWSSMNKDGDLKLGGRKSSFKTRIFGKSDVSGKKNFRKKLAKVAYTVFAFFAVFLFVGTLGALAYLQNITAELPDPEAPFDNSEFQTASSVMYDRNGKELYRLFGDENRDILRIPDDKTLTDVVPSELKWAVLAAEDIDFYQHPGIDVTGILRCATKLFKSCGGSTITQQIIKLTVKRTTKDYREKIRELVLALQLENKVKDKDKILLLYMNIVNEGGNMYGFKVAAKNFFGKELKDLTLAEAAVIAAVPNNPSVLSPVLPSNSEQGQRLLEERKKIIFDNMLRYKDKINTDVRNDREARARRENRDLTDEEKEDFITEDRIAKAREEKLAYKEYEADIKAPHFVFFAKDLLTQRGYNNGEPFTAEEINKGGYKIYTTLDLDINNIALDVIQNYAINRYGKQYGAANAATMLMTPKNGEIIAMVGSKCYSNRELANCSELDKSEDKRFDSKVNIFTTQQQPGSSIKPFVFLEAYRQGKISPASVLADIKMDFGKYVPKNSDGTFKGFVQARYALGQSRNIPAISLLESVGYARLAEIKKDIGYTINIDPATYGAAAALGAQDVYGYEHATGFATLANGGKYVPYEAITKIIDRNGEVIYEHGNKEKDFHEEPKQVLDEKAVFLVNDTLNPRSAAADGNSPVKTWKDKRDVAGKTGTSEENRDNWFALWTPDVVSLSWTGNNDNTRMKAGAFGSTNVEPWVGELMKRVQDSQYFKARTPFNRPDGIVRGKVCNKIDVSGEKKEFCDERSDYYIRELTPPVYRYTQKAFVCVDQQDKLARDIDKATKNAIEKEFTYVKAVVDKLQKFIDEYQKDKQGLNGAPTEFCNVLRSPNGDNPWAEIASPLVNATYTDKITTNVTGFSPTGVVTKLEIYLGTRLLHTNLTPSYTGNLDIPNGLLSGEYDFIVKAFDDKGKNGVSSVRIKINGVDPQLRIISPTGGDKPVNTQVRVRASHNGTLNDIRLYVKGPDGQVVDFVMTGDADNLAANWTPTQVGKYELWVKSTRPIVHESTHVNINVI